MSWALMARKDFEDTIRSWTFWAIIGISLLLLAIVTFGIVTGDTQDAGQERVYVMFNSLGSQLIVPITALIFGYLAIAGERESGSLRVLFGLTHGRRDVLAGKLLSRTTVMAVGMVVASAVVAGLVLVLFDSFDLGTFLVFFLVTELLAITFTGVAVAVSSTTGTRARAMAGAMGSFVLFSLLWYPFVAMIHYAAHGELAGLDAPDWYLFLLMLNPLQAYKEVLGQQIGQHLSSWVGWYAVVEDISTEQLTDYQELLLSSRSGDAFYTTEWFAVVVFLAWFAVPVLVGYWRFQKADLN